MNIIKQTKIWFTFSGVLITLSAISLLTFGLPLGIDFTGGTQMEITFDNPEDIDSTALTSKLKETNLETGEIVVVATSEAGNYLLKLKEIDEETHNELKFFIKENFGNFTEFRFNTIGPTIGETLKEKAVMAIGIAILVIVFFVAFTFRSIPRRLNSWKFGIAAIIALAHDIFITIGIFSILSKTMGFEVNALFITALLTILGYSVNDTIVIFDRIRENLRKWKKDETFTDIAEKSLKQSLARSVNTSLSTLFTLSALFILGGESIKFFVLALIIGTIVGTYSSLFIASPILVAWQRSKFVK